MMNEKCLYRHYFKHYSEITERLIESGHPAFVTTAGGGNIKFIGSAKECIGWIMENGTYGMYIDFVSIGSG